MFENTLLIVSMLEPMFPPTRDSSLGYLKLFQFLRFKVLSNSVYTFYFYLFIFDKQPTFYWGRKTKLYITFRMRNSAIKAGAASQCGRKKENPLNIEINCGGLMNKLCFYSIKIKDQNKK
ncbi:hypothetical protein CsSME_00005316 [Camellia sinensis var. sinensis]